jgi:hypothetical protein
MALVLKDRVRETSTTIGTSTITLAGAVSGFQSFSNIGNGNTTYYTIAGGTEWEVGLGTYTSSGNTLSRDTVLSSSNSNSLVNFSAGTKEVFVTYPANKSIYQNASSIANITSLDVTTALGYTPGTVTSVTGTAPVSVATGTTTPVISMAAATASVNGYLTSTDWTTFNSKASYPSAGIAVSTGSAWTTSLTAPSGTIVGTTDTQTLTNKTINGNSNTISNIGLSTQVTGTLPVANGGTGVTTLTTAYGVLAAGTTATGALQNIGTGTSAQVLTSNGSGALPTFQDAAASPYVLKNRIINGDMRIDQRNAGASVTISTGGSSIYSLDRWCGINNTDGTFTIQRSTVAPTGFTNSLLATVTATDTSIGADQSINIRQNIEGFNVADLGWGTANAQTITLSFWVRSSVVGQYGVAVNNSAYNRSYVSSITINSADTYEYKTITILGDTSGTWLTDNGIGLVLQISLAVGSNRIGTANTWASDYFYGTSGQTQWISTSEATFYITGVQLEVGTSATPFERRLYGQELANCQRYYYRIVSEAGFGRFGNAYNNATTNAKGIVQFPVTMRTIPSALEQSGTAANYAVITSVVTNLTVVPALASNGTNSNMGIVDFGVASGLTAGQGSQITSASGVTTAYLGWSAEL